MIKGKEQRRKKRHFSIRKSLNGTHERPRIVVFRSNKNIYASIVIDEETPNRVLATVSSLAQDFKGGEAQNKGWNVQGASLVGALLAKRAKELGIERVVFDRGGYKYAGRVKAVADAAREGGLKF